MAALNHPYICTLHDVGPTYLVMEYAEGPTLAERIAAGRDGRELFYRQGDALMAVTVDTGRGFRVERPRRLFTGDYSGASRDRQFDVAPDSRRFAMVKSDDSSTLRQITVVHSWFEELKRRVPKRGK